MRPVLACPRCRGPLNTLGTDRLECPADHLTFDRQEGIWRFLLPERADYYSRFIKEYAYIRAAEGRSSPNSSYYRALPFKDLTGRWRREWAIRAAGFRAFIARVLEPLEAGIPLSVLDLGAGNGWLSGRLAARGHSMTAIDLQTGDQDGLGAHIHYQPAFTAVQAEFDYLPLAAAQFDLAVFNASFHYSENYETTLQALLPLLKPEGNVVILDTPIYHNSASGAAMVRERQAQFESQFGTRSDALLSESFLTYERIQKLTVALGLYAETVRPTYPLSWRLRPWLARLRGRREPADFAVVILEQNRAAD